MTRHETAGIDFADLIRRWERNEPEDVTYVWQFVDYLIELASLRSQPIAGTDIPAPGTDAYGPRCSWRDAMGDRCRLLSGHRGACEIDIYEATRRGNVEEIEKYQRDVSRLEEMVRLERQRADAAEAERDEANRRRVSATDSSLAALTEAGDRIAKLEEALRMIEKDSITTEHAKQIATYALAAPASPTTATKCPTCGRDQNHLPNYCNSAFHCCRQCTWKEGRRVALCDKHASDSLDSHSKESK